MKHELDDTIIDFAQAKGLEVDLIAPYILKIRELKDVIIGLEIEYQDLKSKFLLTDNSDPLKNIFREKLIKTYNIIKNNKLDLDNTINKFEYVINNDDNLI